MTVTGDRLSVERVDVLDPERLAVALKGTDAVDQRAVHRPVPDGGRRRRRAWVLDRPGGRGPRHPGRGAHAGPDRPRPERRALTRPPPRAERAPASSAQRQPEVGLVAVVRG